MKQYPVEITGITPMMFNRVTLGEEGDAPKGRKFSVEEYRQQALTHLHRREDGEIFIPNVNIKNAMIATAVMLSLKHGRKGLYTFMKPLVFISPTEVLLNKKEPDYIDERPGRIPPRTGALVMLYRPAFKEGWKAQFNIEVVDDRLSVENIKLSLEEAGILNGIGSGRPDFGRFTVKWLDQQELI